MPRGFPLQDESPGMKELFHDLAVQQEEERAARRELLTAPGAKDLTFGSLLDEMIRTQFTRQERAPGNTPRYFTSCNHCGGTDAARTPGHLRTSSVYVEHKIDCSLAKHLPRLTAMATEGVT